MFDGTLKSLSTKTDLKRNHIGALGRGYLRVDLDMGGRQF